MKLPKYNLAYNTRDQLQLLAINASERKHDDYFSIYAIKSQFRKLKVINL